MVKNELLVNRKSARVEIDVWNRNELNSEKTDFKVFRLGFALRFGGSDMQSGFSNFRNYFVGQNTLKYVPWTHTFSNRVLR